MNNFSSIGEALAGWASKGRGAAFTFISDMESEIEFKTLSYEELHQRACSIATELLERVQTGSRVLLWYKPGLEFIESFWACIYAGLVAVPLFFPDSISLISRGIPRLRAIFSDCGAVAILTHSEIIDALGQLPQIEEFRSTHTTYIATDLIRTHGDSHQFSTLWRQDRLALLQYTSGSTGSPRGVMVTHENLIANQRMISEVMPPNCEKDISVGWLPFHHDMGLIGNVVQSVYRGAHSYIMAPIDFVRRPLRWLSAISRLKATISGGPNFAFDLCLQRLSPEQVHGLDLSSWRLAFCGAEPIRETTLRRFTQLLEPAGFRSQAWLPVYGLAEATLLVSGVKAVDKKSSTTLAPGFSEDMLKLNRAVPDVSSTARRLVGCGIPPNGLDVRIVNPDTVTILLPGEVGEIWVSGASVCAGYWNNQEMTERNFQARIPGLNVNYLRTGDLGFIFENEVFVTGRLKDIVIIRGKNHYPSDIEETVGLSHPNIYPGRTISFSVDRGNHEALIVVAEISKISVLAIEDLRAVVKNAILKDHSINADEIVLVRTGSIPRTSSGKLQRAACKKMFLNGEIEAMSYTKFLGERR